MRISDWSSDVCSSDLFARAVAVVRLHRVQHGGDEFALQPVILVMAGFRLFSGDIAQFVRPGFGRIGAFAPRVSYCPRSEESRVGKECAVSGELGGRRIHTKKKNTKSTHHKIHT